MTELKLPADIKWELTILEIVHGFNLEVLRNALQEEVLTPTGLDVDTLRAPSDPSKTLADIRAWLKLLDLAITPAMIREPLTNNIDQDLAEALLRYFVRKKSHSNYDRDKTDFIVTYLYRNPRVKGQWETRGYSMDGVAPIPPFEIALLEILEETDLPDISNEQARILDEFEYLHDEADGFRDFDQLIDSNIIQRAREMKDSLGPALYHPHVLAIIAPYNAFFAGKFEELFKAATAHIKNFAEQAQQNGGSLHSPVQGDITVKQLAELREDEILASEYMRAQEQLRYVSKLKKAVDSNNAAQRAPQPRYGAASIPQTPAPASASPFASAAPRSPMPAAPVSMPPRPTAPHRVSSSGAAAAPGLILGAPTVQPSANAKRVDEENRLTSVQESVKSFVKTADPRFRSVVPMGFGNLVLSQAESDAYCADYLKESSFRGDNARVLVRIPALMARMTSEIEQIERQKNLIYLWRPHAESLNLLLSIKDEITKTANDLIQLASQRGLTEKVNTLKSSIQKLNTKAGEAVTLLTIMNARD